MNVKEIDELIAKYQLCETSSDEEKMLLSYLQVDPSHVEELVRADARFAAVLMGGRKKYARRRFLRLAVGFALPLAAAIAAAVLILPHVIHKTTDGPALAMHADMESPSASISRLTLSDGSMVRLKAGSTLNCADGFGETNRDVVLNGEGYFDVVHDASLPFVVTGGEVKVQVLGTVFEMKTGADETVETMLASGSVRILREGHEPYLLHPGEKGIVHLGDGSLDVIKTSPWEELMEQYGSITMHDASIREICDVINNVFDVRTEIRYGQHSDTVATFGFSRSSDPATVVELLSMISSNSIQIKQ